MTTRASTLNNPVIFSCDSRHLTFFRTSLLVESSWIDCDKLRCCVYTLKIKSLTSLSIY